MRRPQHLDNTFDGFAHQGSHAISLPPLFSKIFEGGNGKMFRSKTINSGATLSEDPNVRETFLYKFSPSVNFTKLEFEGHANLQADCTYTQFKEVPSNIEARTLKLSHLNMRPNTLAAIQDVSNPEHKILGEIGDNLNLVRAALKQNTDLWSTKKVVDLGSNEQESFMGNLFLNEKLAIHVPKIAGLEHGPLQFPSVCYHEAINALVQKESSPLNGAQLLTMAMSHCGNLASINKSLQILNPDSIYAVHTHSTEVDFDSPIQHRRCQCNYNEGCNTENIQNILKTNSSIPCVSAMTCIRDLHRHAIGMKPMLQAMGKYSSDMTCLGSAIVPNSENGNPQYTALWAASEDMARPGHLLQTFAFKFNSDAAAPHPVEFHMALGHDDCESLASLGCLSSENIFAYGDSLIRDTFDAKMDEAVFAKIHPNIRSNVRWAAETMALFRNKIIVGNCFGITTSPSAAGTESNLQDVNMQCEVSKRDALKKMKQIGRGGAKMLSEVPSSTGKNIRKGHTIHNVADMCCTFKGTEDVLGGHSYTLHGLKIDGDSESKLYSRFLFTFGEHTGCVTPVNCSEVVHVETMHPFGKTDTTPILSHESAKLFDTNLAEIKFKGLPQTFCQLFKNQLSMNNEQGCNVQNMMIMNVDSKIVGGPAVFYRSVVIWKNYIFVSPDKETGTLRPGIHLHDLLSIKDGVPVVPPSHLTDTSALPSGAFMVPMYNADSDSARSYANSWQELQESIGQARTPSNFLNFIYTNHFPQLETKHFESKNGYRGMISFTDEGNSQGFAESVRKRVTTMKQNWSGLNIQHLADMNIAHGDGVRQQQLFYTTVIPTTKTSNRGIASEDKVYKTSM
jgi:hypothetical protein